MNLIPTEWDNYQHDVITCSLLVYVYDKLLNYCCYRYFETGTSFFLSSSFSYCRNDAEYSTTGNSWVLTIEILFQFFKNLLHIKETQEQNYRIFEYVFRFLAPRPFLKRDNKIRKIKLDSITHGKEVIIPLKLMNIARSSSLYQLCEHMEILMECCCSSQHHPRCLRWKGRWFRI